ncbi:MAG: transglycosylase SLT domain-containing protein [Bacteroidota bacterium]
MKKICYILFALLAVPSAFGFTDGYSGKIQVKHLNEDSTRMYIHDSRIYAHGLDTLKNIVFWNKLIKLSPDSGYVNVASTRDIICTMCVKSYQKKTDVQKTLWRDSIRKSLNLPETEKILFSTGKSDFYLLENVMADIGKGIQIFEDNGVDPFYAQAILLIESPGRLQKSNVGAYGPFQLMKGVARAQGLKVNKYVDERKDFDKSAWAAARLIKTICVPYTDAILNKYGITYNSEDLWYKLLVLHVYHAGAGNVDKAVAKIPLCELNGDFIKQLWQTTAGAFGNASQSYSQVVIACMIELDNLINRHCEEIYKCQQEG